MFVCGSIISRICPLYPPLQSSGNSARFAMPMRDCNAIVNAIETTQWLVEGNTNLPLMVAGELTELEGGGRVRMRLSIVFAPARHADSVAH